MAIMRRKVTAGLWVIPAAVLFVSPVTGEETGILAFMRKGDGVEPRLPVGVSTEASDRRTGITVLRLGPGHGRTNTADRVRGAMAAVATWIFLPSLALTLVAGLLAIALNRAFHSAGWAWVKLASGILMFEYGFVGVQGPMQREADHSAAALVGQVDPATLAGSLRAEQSTLWVLLAVATFNVVFGIWRPRLAWTRG